jgi:hypothetical protein
MEVERLNPLYCSLLSEVGTDNKKSERQPAPTINNKLLTTVTQQPETSHNH